MMFVTEIIAVLTVLVFSFIAYIKWTQKYWARRNVPYVEPTSMFGNVENPFRQKHGLFVDVKRTYDELKRRGEKHGGMYIYTTPTYVPVDVELVKGIMTRDFQHFTDRGFFSVDDKKDPLSANLFSIGGEKWKNLRVKLTPTFTSGKMKMMFHTLQDCTVPMLAHIDKLCETKQSADMKDIFACFTTDVIGSCVFGLECNSFKDPEADFRRYGRQIVVANWEFIAAQFVYFTSPWLFKIKFFTTTPPVIEKFFLDTIRNVMNYRKSNNVKRNDFIQLFIEMQEKAKADNVEGITVEYVAAQGFLFFIAGFHTSATTMSFCLHELSYNQDIQDRLREEIRKTMKANNGVLTYDAVMTMEYLDKVVNETLRKYPPVPFLNRECSLEYKVPGSDVTLEKGTKVFISTLGMHRDEEFYPDPDKFDPERFAETNKAERHAFSFLPFGDGPRNCIGLRFGLMQTKTGLCTLLNRFRFTPGKTEKYSISFDPLYFVLTKSGGVMLNTERLSDSV